MNPEVLPASGTESRLHLRLMASSCENADSQREPLLQTGPIPWKLHPIDFVDRFLSENIFPTDQRIENIQQMTSPQDQRTYRENDRYGEEYQRQSIVKQHSCSPEDRRNAEYERRKLPHRRVPDFEEPQHWEYQRPYQNRKNYQQSPFKHPRKYDKFQRNNHPYHWHNDAPPPWTQNELKSRGNTHHPRHLDTEPRSPRQDRCEPREKRKSKPRSTIQSQSPSTVTDQAPSTSAPPPDQNPAVNAVEPIFEDDEDGSQRTPLDHNVTSQTVVPSPGQASSSSTQVSSQPPVDNVAKNLPEKSSTSLQNGSKNQSPVQIASNHQTASSSSSEPASLTSSQPHVDNAAKNPPEKSLNSSQTGSKNQSSVQIASNHQTASASSSGPALSKSLQPAVQSVIENPANKTEHSPKNSNIKSTNMEKERVPKIVFILKKFPCLYDKADPYNRDQIQMEKAWTAISKELNVPVKICQKQWNSQYRKHRRIMKETDGQNFGKYAEFMSAINFLPPPENRTSKNNAVGVDATMDQAQTEQAASQSVPDIDEQFAKAMVGELRQFSPKVRTSIKADIYQVFAKWAKFTQDKSD